MATPVASSIFAGVGEGNLALRSDFVLTVTSELALFPVENLLDWQEMGRPWRSAVGTTVTLEWNWGGELVQASHFGLIGLDVPENGLIDLELFTTTVPSVPSLKYRVLALPAWSPFQSPSIEDGLLPWGQFPWGGSLPTWAREAYRKDFLWPIVAPKPGDTAVAVAKPVAHRSGRMTFTVPDGDANALGYWQASYLDISNAYLPSRGLDLDWRVSRRAVGPPIVEDPSGVVRSTGGSTQRKVDASWRALNRDEMFLWFDSIQAVYGLDRPFIFYPFAGQFFAVNDAELDLDVYHPSAGSRWMQTCGLVRLLDFVPLEPDEVMMDGVNQWRTGGKASVVEWL